MNNIINNILIEKFIKEFENNPNKKIDQNFSKELWENFTENKCILGSCNCKSIKSHLYPKWYLQKNGNNFINTTYSNLKAKWLSTPLFCKTHDDNLFKLSDEINDFTDLIKDNTYNKLKNYFLKILFFKYKTLLIQQNFLEIELQQNNIKNIETYNLLKNQFEKINIEFQKYNNFWGSNIDIIYSWCIWFYDSKKYTLFSNICFIEENNVPFWLLFSQDKWWISLWICIYWDNYPIDLVRQIKYKIHFIKLKFDFWKKDEAISDLIKYITETFKQEKFYNRTLYLNKDILDIWLYTEKK